MNKIQKIISSLVVLLSVVLIILFRTVPAGKLWDEYVVLYVPIETSDQAVLLSFSENGIDDVVSLSGQFLPLSISENSVEYSMYKTSRLNSDKDYIDMRKSYFFDKTNSYRLYYIPKEYDGKIKNVVSDLSDMGIESGLDKNGSYPIIYPLVVLFIAVAISFFSRNKIFFILTSLIPLLYVICNPFFPITIAIILLLFCCFFISNIWKREGAIKYLKHFIFIPLCLLAAIFCSFASSVVSGLLFIAASGGTFCVVLDYYYLEEYFRNRKSFVPVYIRSAKMVSMFGRKTRIVFSIVSGGLTLLLILFAFTSSGLIKQINEKVLLPSSSNNAEASLPQLEDYYKWTWDVTTYPYKSLNNTDNKIGDEEIVFPTYLENDGIITVTENVYKYDKNYKSQVFNNIDNLQFDSIEKVLSSQGSDFLGGYNSTSSYHIDLFGIIMIIVCYSILLFIYFSIIIRLRKGKKGARK